MINPSFILVLEVGHMVCVVWQTSPASPPSRVPSPCSPVTPPSVQMSEGINSSGNVSASIKHYHLSVTREVPGSLSCAWGFLPPWKSPRGPSTGAAPPEAAHGRAGPLAHRGSQGGARAAVTWSSTGHMRVSCNVWSGFNCLFSKPHFTQNCNKSR